MQDKRDELYDNLINSGKVSDAEIGSREEFKNAITDEGSSRQFYQNLIGSGIFDEDDLGTEDAFYNSIYPDFSGLTGTSIIEKARAGRANNETISRSEARGLIDAGLDGAQKAFQNTYGSEIGAEATTQRNLPNGKGQNVTRPMSAQQTAVPPTTDSTPAASAETTEEDYRQAVRNNQQTVLENIKALRTMLGGRYANPATFEAAISDKGAKFDRLYNEYKAKGGTLSPEELKTATSAATSVLEQGKAWEEHKEQERIKAERPITLRKLDGSDETVEIPVSDFVDDFDHFKDYYRDYSIQTEEGVWQPMATANLYGENANVQLPISEKELNEARERTKARRDQFRTQILSQLDSIDKRLKERRNEKDTWGLDMRLHGAQRKLEDIREALKQGDLARSKDVWKELKGMWSGLASGVGDPDLYSLGVISAIDNMNRADAINKYANGEALTDTQKDMLELEALASAVNQYNGSYSNGTVGYQVGKSLPESLGFMIALMANPASGLAKKETQRIMRRMVRRYGNNAVTKMLTYGTRAGLDAAEMGVATVTTGMPRIVGDTMDRYMGNATFDIDENTGAIRYDGQTDREGIGRAFKKALGAGFIENYSEAMGEYFAPLRALLKSGTAKGAKKIGMNRLADALQSTGTKRLTNSLNQFKEAAKFNGFIGEVLEEEIGMAMNALTVGDNSFKKGEDGYIFDKDTQLTTALSVGLMCGTFSAVEHGGSKLYEATLEHRVNKADKTADRLIGKDWEKLRDIIDVADADGIKQALIKAAAEGTLDNNKKLRAATEYATRRLASQGYNSRALQMAEEETAPDNEQIETNGPIVPEGIIEGGEDVERGVPEAQGIVHAMTPYERGVSMNADARIQAKRDFDAAETAVKTAFDLPAELTADELRETLFGDTSSEDAIERMEASGNYTPEQIQAVKDFDYADTVMSGVYENAETQQAIDEAVAQRHAEIDAQTGSDGNIHPVKLVATVDGTIGEAFITDPEVTFNSDGTVNAKDGMVIVTLADGTTKPISVDEIDTYDELSNAEELKQTEAENITAGMRDAEMQRIEDAINADATGRVNVNGAAGTANTPDTIDTTNTSASPAGTQQPALRHNAFGVPMKEDNTPDYEAAPADAVWNTLTNESDEATASTVASTMASNYQKQLDKAKKKQATGNTPQEIMASAKANKEEVERLTALVEHWNNVAAVPATRQQAETPNIDTSNQQPIDSSGTIDATDDNKSDNRYGYTQEVYKKAEDLEREHASELERISLIENDDEFEEEANKIEANLPYGYHIVVDKNGVTRIVPGEPSFYGRDSIHATHRRFSIGERIQLEIDGRHPHVVVTRIDSNGKVSEAIDFEDGRTIVQGGRILSASEIQGQKKRLSSVLDQNGSPFLLSSSGSIDLGEIKPATKLKNAPIRLSLGDRNNGYIHIENRHGKQIRSAGYASVIDFVEYVAKNYNEIKRGESYKNKQGGENETFLVQLTDGHNNTLYVQLSRDGEYWNVNSAGIFSKRDGRDRETIWSASEVQNSGSATTGNALQYEPNADKSSSSNGTASNVSKGKNTQSSGNNKTKQKKNTLTPMQQRERALGDYLDFYDYVERTLAASGRGLKVIWGDDPVTGTRGLGAHLTGKSESERRQYIWLLGTKKNGAFYPEQLAEELWQGYREERNDNGLPIDDIGNEQASDAFAVVLDVLRSHNSKESMMREAEERHSDMQRQYDEAERDQANNWAIGQGFNDIDEWQDYNDYCYQKAEEDSRYYDEVISIFAEQYEQEDNERRITESHRVAAQSDEGAVPGRTGEGTAVVQGEQESPAGERDTTADGPSSHNAERGNRIDSDGSLGTGTGEGREVGRSQSGNLPASVAPLVADLERQSDERDALHQAWLSGEINDSEKPTAGYSIEPTTYTNKKGKTTPMHLVTFGRELSKDEIRAGKELAKESRGWWDREKGGFMMRSEDSAKALAEALNNEEAVQDAQPLSVEDVATVTDQADMKAVDETIKVEQEPQTTPQYDYDREDDVYDKTLTGLRNVLNDRKRGAIPNIKSIENVIRDLRKRAKTIEDGMATAAGETIPQAFDALANLNGRRKAYEQFLVDIRKKMAETERDDALAAHGVKLGDKVMYRGKEATIHDADTKQVTLDVGLAPVLYEVTDWENVELPKPVKEYHGGDRVFSVKHNANKDIFVAHHKDGTVEYTFTDGTKANADEVQDALPEPKKVNVESLMGELNEKGEAKLSDHIEEPQQEESTEQPKQEEKKAKSKWVDDADAERFEELRRRLRQKLGGQLNMEVDPEAFALGVEMSYLMLKHGARKFAEFAKQMIEALGENVRPYLKSFYNGARDLPEMAEYEKELTPYDEVRTFDVMNFDKEGAKDIVATAEHIVREQAAEREAKEATDKLKQERNEQRKEIEQQVAADTEVTASEAETVASKVESQLPSAKNEREVNDLAKSIDDAIDKVNDQLALLGYYEAEPVEEDFNEAYGYMRNAEKKAVKNVTELFKTLTKELGISDPVVYDANGKKQKSVTANIAPAGGDVTMRFMLNRDKGVELYINFMLEPDYENNRDNLVLKGIMFRPEKNRPNGGRDYLSSNNFFPADVTVPQMLQGIRSVCREWLPAQDNVATAQRVAAEDAGNQKEKTSKGSKSKKKSVSLQEQSIPDLFSGLFGEDELNSNSNDTARTDETKGSSRQDGTVGSVPADRDRVLDTASTGRTDRGKTARVSDEAGAVADGERGGLSSGGSQGGTTRVDNMASEAGQPLPDGGRSVRDGAASDGRGHDNRAAAATSDGVPSQTGAGSTGGRREQLAERRVRATKQPEPKFTRNYLYPEDASEIDNMTPQQRLKANVEALEVLRNLMRDGREATAEEREILGRYRGWGGVDLGRAYSTDMMRKSFTDRWGAPTEQGKLLTRLADVIDALDPNGERGVLSAINHAALTSYYTPTGVAKVMNRFVELAGFKGGSMLDPSMGNGIFEGTMSKAVQQRTMIHGVELDWLTGQIARNLYPDANILVTGYQDAGTADNAYDVVMSNIPFGDFSVTDKAWKHDSSPVRKAAQNRIHNYFAVKMLDNTRPGGLCVIMTSNAILDTKGNQIIREHIADNAEVLGVVRLPDNTFKGAGTSVVTDVIFLRKYKDDTDRSTKRSDEQYLNNIEKPFLTSGELQLVNPTDGKSYKVAVNGYFTKNKGMMIGDAKAGGQYRADQFGLGSDMSTDELAAAMQKLVEKKIVGDRKGKLFDTHKTVREVHQAVSEAYKGDGTYISSGNIVEQDGKFGIVTTTKSKYGDVSSTFTEMPELKGKANRVRAMLPVRKAMKQVIDWQIQGMKESDLAQARAELQKAYDDFTKKFGRLNTKENDFLTEDIDGYTMRSLEKWKDGKFVGLSDIFTKNTIKPALDLSTAKTPQEAISLSLAEYGEINSAFMEEVLGESWAEQCGETLFKEPFTTDSYLTADAYLSGDVKTKLEQAREAAKEDKTLERNVKALEAVQPEDIPFDEISIRMGARWIPSEIYTDFMYDMFGIHKNDWKGNNSGVEYMPEADQYVVNVASNELGGEADQWRTSRRSASEVFTAALQDKSLSVFDTIKEDGKEIKILNKEETELLNGKIQDLRTAFEDWLSQNPDREEALMRLYNDKFNRTVLRKFDGSHLRIPGLMGMELRPHQKDAVWMLINNRGGIVDHIVGAGKTLVMQSAIMEMRRMGIAKKPMIIGLKATCAQIAKEFREAYPAARILAPTEKDFSEKNRKKFMSQIALNDYDCVILSHDQYCMLPHTEEVERGVIDEQMAQLDAAIEFLYGQRDKNQLTKKQIKGLEKRKANLETKLASLLDRKIDREFTFEGLGVDYLFVDECQHFKSLPYVSTYDRVAGLGDKKGSQRAIALLNGVRYLQKMHQGDRGTIFLSGTTISNSLSEIYHLLNYLRPSEMQKLGMTTFDAWAGNFAIHTAELEYGVTNELKEKDRFRSLTNIPELSKMYAEIADVRNDMNLKLPKPKMRSHIVTVPQSDLMTEINAEIVNMVRNKDGHYFGIDSKDTTPWGLLASTLSAKAAINPRLIDDAYEDEGGKIPAVCEQVKKIYDQFKEQKGTQLIFCDTGVPSKGKKYDAYSDIINRLVNDYGIPRSEIADIHVANTDEKRKALFAKVNEGSVRILIGGTKNMGTGVNVQKRIVAMHHVDVPWTPADREQREGRGVRQGNEIARDFNDNNVDVYFYATEGSLDMYKYQLQETKGKLFAQFKSGTIGERTFDEGEAEGDFDPAEVVAMLSGNPVIFEKSKQDKKVEKLRRAKRAYESDWQRRRSRYEELQTKQRNFERLISLNESDVRSLERRGFTPDEEGKYPATVTIGVRDEYSSRRTFDKPKEAGEYLHSLLKKGKKVELSGFGQKANVTVPITGAGLFGKPVAELDSYGGIKYTVDISDDDTAAGTAFRNLLQKVYTNKNVYERNLEDVKNQLRGADPGENKFPKQAELDEALKEKKRLDNEYKKLSDEKPKVDLEKDIKTLAKEKGIMAVLSDQGGGRWLVSVSDKEGRKADGVINNVADIDVSDALDYLAARTTDEKDGNFVGSLDDALEREAQLSRQLTSGEDVRPATQEEREETAYMADHFNAIGIPTSTDWEEGQRVLDMANGKVTLSRAQKRALETAPLIPKEGSPADISNADSAKVQQKLETLAKNLEKVSSHRKNFLDEVADALGAKKHGSNSRYVTIEAKNGKIVAIRLSNHNATVSTFDKHDEDEGISIVVSPRSNQGMNDGGNAHIVEFFYPEIAIRKAEGKPLAEIVRSIEQSLYSGEYKDTTGLAEVQEVNANPQRPSYQKANVSQAVFVSNARRAVEGIRQEKATPEQWLAMLQKQGGLKAGEDKWLGLSDWLKGQDKKSLTKQEVLDFIDQNQIQIEEVKYGKGLFSKNSKANLESELKEGIAKGKSIDDVLLRWDFVFDDNKWYEYHDKRFTVDEDGNIHTEEELLEPINDTRLAYTTKGLKNKREIALTVPTIESWNEDDAIHFGDAGEGRAVAWIRFGETTDADGNRVLVIDEIQSKRHQEGREKGYREVHSKEYWEAKAATARADFEDYKKIFRAIPKEQLTEADADKYVYLQNNVLEAEKRAKGEYFPDSRIPDAPFDKNWHELAMKRMLRYAAENGYDKVAWTTGEQQAERYNIGDAVERIISYDFPEVADLDGRKSKKIEIRLKDSETMTMRVDQNGKVIEGRSETEGKMLSDIVGKEIAKSIMNGDGRDGSIFDANRDIPAKIIDGDGLRIGGEGMKGFYDRMLPSFVNKYVKKWGAKVGEVELPDIGDQTYRLNSEGKMKRGLSMWSVDVTPEMKRDVMEGQPMFFRTPDGQAYGFTLNGKIYLDPRIATAETPIHEYGHLWVEALAEANPEAWEHLKGELEQDADLVNYVKGRYPDLEGDELWEEVFTHFSGRRGRERMEEERRRMMNEEPDLMGKARVARMFYRLRRALKRFWTMARDLFAGNNARLKAMKAEDFADAMMADLVHGFNPRTGELAEQRIRRMADKYAPRYQFVGERGARQADLAEERTHRIDNLTVAREMEDAGKDAVAIKLATGWERGGDGKWRYEIPDIDRETVVKGLREPIKAHRKAVDDMERQEERLQGQAFSVSYKIPKRLDSRFTEEEKAKYRQMREKAAALEGEALSVRKEINALKDKVEKEGYETTLGDVLGKDSELIKAYPSLADVHVKVYERAQRGEGSYNSETNTIKLSAAHRSLDSIYSTMLHEIQHAIQHIEGFARGGNLGTVLSDNAYLMSYRDDLLGTLVKVEKQLKETRDQLAAQDFSRYTKEALTSREASLQLDALNINNTLDDIDNNRISQDVADRYYRRLGGEVEARNVQRRRGYSEEERRRSLAVATEDVERNEQHFLFGEDESKSTADNNREGETLFTEKDDKRQGGMPESPARELAEKLNLGDRIEFVIDTNTLTDTNADNERRMRRSKGFFDTNTGKIIIVLPNHTSEDDVLRTVLHESVAHYGLRELFKDDFDTFLDNVYNNVPLGIKARIRDYQARRKCSLHEATEEYLASLAEDTNFEQAEKTGVWPTIKRLLITLLRSAHVRLPKALSDEDLRYILWRSFDNLRTKGRPNIIDRARDITMQSRLGVRNFTSGQNNTNQNRLFRDADEMISDDKVLARAMYEERLKTSLFQITEALQDSMLGLKEAYRAIASAEGAKDFKIEDIPSYENAYLAENALSSVNKAEMDAYAEQVFRPLMDEVALLAKNKEGKEQLIDYLMAKHGLERNRVMAQREFDKYQEKHPSGKKTLADFRRDYAGLTAVFGEEGDTLGDIERKAGGYVDNYESQHDTDELWERIREATRYSVYKSFTSGIINKKTFDKISNMYEYYIPLRGFDEATSDEIYTYLNGRDGVFNAPIRTARGRVSKADDPLATIKNMADSGILQGNRNLMKQKFLNYVMRHPSNLASVHDLWLKRDDVTGEWTPVFPDVNPNDTPEEVERKVNAFEERMIELQESDPTFYKRGHEATDIPFRVINGNMKEHQVLVKRNGRNYVITINGNPRAAQALNGQTNPDNETTGAVGAVLRAGEWVNRQLSTLYTTKNPDFIASNFLRDAIYANSMTWVKESPAYAAKYHANFIKFNPITMGQLFKKYNEGRLDRRNKTERYFAEFMHGGGETGYSNLKSVEQQKREIDKELKRANGKLSVTAGLRLLGKKLDDVNRAVENCARFAAFVTSREDGRDIPRSVWDAKEISVNFNKKGAGAKFYGEDNLPGNIASLVSGLGRASFVFWNAAVQGTANITRYAKRHPAKFATAAATLFVLGALIPAIAGGGGDDDDKNAYFNLPEYVRRSNIMFRLGEQWLSIPLPIEYRAIYGLGELLMSAAQGQEDIEPRKMANKMASQLSQVLPLDFLEGGGGLNAFVPSWVKPIVEVGINKSWTGLPIAKETPFNKDMPAWTKTYKNTDQNLISLAASMNEATGGDEFTKGWADWNPAKLEYLLNGYLGGISNTIEKLAKTGETMVGKRDFDWRDVLIVNRVIKTGDERTAFRKANEKYYTYKEEFDKFSQRLRGYKKRAEEGDQKYLDKLDELNNSKDMARYEIFKEYDKKIAKLKKRANNLIGTDEEKEAVRELNREKLQLVETIDGMK